ncbi:nicotinamide-nucleotide amidohydrolase family protein [Paraflavitalea speifideaquila]|uniref:nicotinamide-nucleotide amidohydrolase family protein n=1 Tax=Paraflavitalea speifideaquila TaxID=3076558 RepID=UPI0028E1DB87|nr:nicotinamide-nucleotide amidohydrolase family protein [Paraflavitalea speifideiaquila]
MKDIMTAEVIPRLRQHFTMPHISHRTLLTAGIGESYLADIIQNWEEKLPAHLKLAYLPNYGMVRLRITGSGPDQQLLEQELDSQFAQVKNLVKEWMVIDEDLPLQVVVGQLLKKQGKTMATAESCTGGYIAHLITSIPGSSAYYKGSIIPYANEVKQNLLNVSPETLNTAGAVSEETVKQMVQGALAALHTDYALVTSGIMGPDGGSPEKPVGMVWMAVGNREKTVTQLMNFRFNRMRNIELTTNHSLNLLRKFIVEQG